MENRFLLRPARHQIATIMQNPRSAFNPAHHAPTRETCLALGKPADDATLTCRQGGGAGKRRARAEALPVRDDGGMLQRMMIAMAVLCESPFIIADEPTTDLDVVAQARILDLLEAL